jgi:SAM-dependent methyltransferase
MTERLKHPLILRAARFGWNFAWDSDFRSIMLLRWKRPDNLFQPFTETRRDRYPEIFRFARETIGDDRSRNLLSFGCSTGEEVFTLRKYFPQSVIKGIDINRRSIATARKEMRREGLNGLIFEGANSTLREPAGHYDGIFAMAVFRHGGLGATGRNGRCDHLIQFDNFENTVKDLARVLRPGGLLFLAHSNFRFADTKSAAAFDIAYRAPDYAAAPGTSLFDRNNCYIADVGYDDVGFRKRTDW